MGFNSVFKGLTCNSTTHTEYIVVFPLQEWLRERATTVRYTYIAYLVNFRFEITTNHYRNTAGILKRKSLASNGILL